MSFVRRPGRLFGVLGTAARVRVLPPVAPPLGTTGLLLDLDPDLPGAVTLSGSTVASVAGANGTTGTITAAGSPTLVTLRGRKGIRSGTTGYLDATAFLPAIKTALGSGPILLVAVVQANTSSGGAVLDIANGASTSFVKRLTVQTNASSAGVRAYARAAADNNDFALCSSVITTTQAHMVAAQFASGATTLAALDHVNAVASSTALNFSATVTDFDAATIGTRRVSGAYQAPTDQTVLRLCLYAGPALVAGSKATALADWATANYGAP